MAASNSSGIQTLLEAEKEASKIVQKARTCKQFHAGSSDQTSRTVEVETEQKRVEIETAFGKNREAVLQKLLETVFTVEPKIHPNARFN
ncbi:H(+)-transporting V1 sector ATPase subunit G [Mortierella sp. AD032]|nr:H(+)-transporting V1 sector ATPase subunit G [Mortierella sp. AD032]